MKKSRLHLHITLVGGQPQPVYQGIETMNPDQILLVCLKETIDKANLIKKELPKYKDKDILIYSMPDSDEEISDAIEYVNQLIPKGITISFNLSGGKKVWSILFYSIFRRHRRSCRFFCIGQNSTLFDLKERKHSKDVNFDMNAQFRLLGHELNEYTPLSDYTPSDFNVLDKIKRLGFNPKTHNELRDITKKFVDDYKKKFNNNLYKHCHEENREDNYLKWNSESRTFELKIGDDYEKLSSEHVENIVLNTGWFELYVAKLISNIYSKEEIRMNCIFRNINNAPKNEIDIIINTGTKLVFVECKTQITSSLDIDKFNSVVHNYGGLGSKALFVTNNEMKAEGKEKCDEYGIMTFFGPVDILRG